MKTLHLKLNERWFDEIASGKKRVNIVGIPNIGKLELLTHGVIIKFEL